jgi:hypothetical protein
MALACNLAYYLEHEPDNRHSEFFNPSGKENHCPASVTNLYCFQDFGTVGIGDEVEVEVAETELNGFTRGNSQPLGETDAQARTDGRLMEDESPDNIKNSHNNRITNVLALPRHQQLIYEHE